MKKLAVPILLLTVGCLMPPTPRVTSSGQRLRPEQDRFLSDPRVDRAEVLATLGPPNFRGTNDVVFVYAWERMTTLKSDEVVILPIPWITVAKVGEHDWGDRIRKKGLFIEFESDGKIRRHEVCVFPGEANLEEASRSWMQRTNETRIP